MNKIAGIDLAAKPKNPTGMCFMQGDYKLLTVYEDKEILNEINEEKPDIVAIDAPLMEKIRIREADKILKKYGAMPPTMASMTMLTKRAMRLVKNFDMAVIEVFPTATAKILGFYDKDYKKMARFLGIEVKNEHELDAYISAYTAYLYLNGKAIEVGKKEKIIIPKVFR